MDREAGITPSSQQAAAQPSFQQASCQPPAAAVYKLFINGIVMRHVGLSCVFLLCFFSFLCGKIIY